MVQNPATKIPTLDTEGVDRFTGTVRGSVVLPDHPNYDEVRAVYNAMIDRFPAWRLRCAAAGITLLAWPPPTARW